mmetsp:Transcript_40567/g.100226  ORF Transcript_40567/g.100226 Transcript_40567/m.100226 type:complete len:214 (-) Transcript_40567:588-1229(-)
MRSRRTPACRHAPTKRAPLCACALKRVLRQPMSASSSRSCPSAERKCTVCFSHGCPQSAYELPAERVLAKTQCSVWKMGKCVCTISSSCAAKGPRRFAISAACAPLQSCVGVRRSKPHPSSSLAAGALAALRLKSPKSASCLSGSSSGARSRAAASWLSRPALRTNTASAPADASTRHSPSSAGLTTRGAATTALSPAALTSATDSAMPRISR